MQHNLIKYSDEYKRETSIGKGAPVNPFCVHHKKSCVAKRVCIFTGASSWRTFLF